MTPTPRILVVGAGASGLAFALAYAHKGGHVHIIDKRPQRSAIQKATGVAQGVWRQLAEYGITAAVINAAIPMRHFVFHDDGKRVANVPVPLINGEPPAHLYPQAELENVMEQALASFGVKVEYGAAFDALETQGSRIGVRLARDGQEHEHVEVDWLIAADGIHSEVRTAIGLPFPGRDYPENWSVAEISTAQWPNSIQAQLYLQSDGVGLFLSQPSPGVIQGILNADGAATALLKHFPDGKLHYERPFKVALRRVPSARSGRVWLIGDAAHVQSPVGGQGLNLAIWDGITLGKALANGDLTAERRLTQRAKRVLFFTDFDYRMLASRSRLIRGIRNRYWSCSAKHPLLARWFFKLISGVW